MQHDSGSFQFAPQSHSGTGSSILSALHDLPSVPWLTRSKIVKYLQLVSVLHFVTTFLAMGKKRG